MENRYTQIPVGRNHAVTKEYLVDLWGLNEREVRRTISEMRAQDFGDDYVIVSLSSGKGYYRTNDLKEIEKFKREVLNRGKHTFLPLKKVNRILSEKTPI